MEVVGGVRASMDMNVVSYNSLTGISIHIARYWYKYQCGII